MVVRVYDDQAEATPDFYVAATAAATTPTTTTTTAASNSNPTTAMNVTLDGAPCAHSDMLCSGCGAQFVAAPTQPGPCAGSGGDGGCSSASTGGTATRRRSAAAGHKELVDNFKEYRIEHNRADLRIVGNGNRVHISHNTGHLRVVGNSTRLKIAHNSGRITYTGNDGRICLGSESPQKAVDYNGCNGLLKICPALVVKHTRKHNQRHAAAAAAAAAASGETAAAGAAATTATASTTKLPTTAANGKRKAYVVAPLIVKSATYAGTAANATLFKCLPLAAASLPNLAPLLLPLPKLTAQPMQCGCGQCNGCGGGGGVAARRTTRSILRGANIGSIVITNSVNVTI